MSGNTCDVIPRRIYYFGVWEPNLSAYLNRKLAAGDLFVDVGANIGYFSLLAAARVGSLGGVVAIEASPTICQELRANINRNRRQNVRIVNVAASDSAGTLKLFIGPETHRGMSSVFPREGCEMECEIPALRLDEILTADEVRKLKIIKIDVEGAEALVMEGLGSILNSAPRDVEIIIEINPDALASLGKSVNAMVEYFAAHGFHPFEIDNTYRFNEHFERVRHAPHRIYGGIQRQTDVVFSRSDADIL